MKELCRVAHEVRIYPLVTLDGSRSQYVSPIIESLAADGVDVSFQKVRYRFQKGAGEMLVVK